MKRSITAAAVTGSLVISAALAGTTPASAAAEPKAVPNSTPTWTAHAKSLGAASDASAVNARVYLAPKGGLAALKELATAVSTRGNSQYGKFLSTAQYYQRFGVSDATVKAVSSYLKSSGLTVDKVGTHNTYLVVHGTVKQANKAFQTSIAKYNHNGRAVQAPSKVAKLPASIAASVLSVYGLDTTPHLTKPKTQGYQAPPPAVFRNAKPCSLYYGAVSASRQADYTTPLPKFNGKTLAYAPCGYTGPQLRSAYEGNPDYAGAGITVAITDAYQAPTIASDANQYAEAHGDGSYVPGQLRQVIPTAGFNRQALCGPSGWYGEETLDVEAVHAMAPDAKIRYYASSSCFDDDFLDTLQRVVDENRAKIVSNSWSDVEEAETSDSINAYESIFLQGAIEGISFAFSSGDNGDELANTAIKQVDYPASDPYVTAVGGTSLAVGSSGQRLFETGWGTVKYSFDSSSNSWAEVGYLYGAGGGSSSLFNRPSYQDGATDAGSRQVPDVGMDADPNTGMLIGETQTFPDGSVKYSEYRIGGTSLASPLFAGMTALSFQHAGHSVGLLNPTIYSSRGAFADIKGTPPNAGVVRADFANGFDPTDGILYSVRTFDQDSSLVTGPGYDQVTGVGSPKPAWLTAND